MKKFNIASVTRDDLRSVGCKDVDSITDDEMYQIADELCDMYCGLVFWVDLDICLKKHNLK